MVLDRRGRVYPQGKLARSIGEGPIILIGKPGVAKGVDRRLAFPGRGGGFGAGFDRGIDGIGQSRGWSEVWVEGGGGVLGALFEKKMIQELHVLLDRWFLVECRLPAGGRSGNRIDFRGQQLGALRAGATG